MNLTSSPLPAEVALPAHPGCLTPRGLPSSAADGLAAFAAIRFRTPDRSALDRPRTIDQLLPPVHQARTVWDHVCAMDFSALLPHYKARRHHPGRPPVDVRILVALWLYATLRGLDSARELSRRCTKHAPYRWICGGVSLNYHTLADFRVAHPDWLRQQLTWSVAQLRQQGLVRLDRIGQDGLRVRASAGTDSLKTAATLERHLQEAREHYDQLLALDKAEQAARAGRKRTKKEAARLRGARQRCQRLQQAQQQVQLVAAAREHRKKGDGETARASETDPCCRKMKMPDGGYRPAYNLQFATDLDSLVIVEAAATNAGSDAGQMAPMVEQIEQQHKELPEEYYADGSFATVEDIEELSDKEVVVYTPLKEEDKQKAKGQDPYARKKGDSDAVAAWRARMGTDQSKQKYKQRGKCEWSNAQARNHGLYQLPVRGLAKVLAVALWYALAINLMRRGTLRQTALAAVVEAAGPSPAGPPRADALAEGDRAAAEQATGELVGAAVPQGGLPAEGPESDVADRLRRESG